MAVFLPCPKCGAINRTEAGKLDRGPVCSRCKARLDYSRPLDVDEEQFERAVNSELPVLVDFWSPGCGPCRSMHPVVEELARGHAGRALVLRLNTDQNPGLSARFRIQGVPTFILFRHGRESGRQVGAVPPAVLANLIERG
jgi:thioredoxin 2